MTPDSSNALLTVDEVAAKLRLSPEWVRQHSNGSRKPGIPSLKLGSRRRFRMSDIEEWLKQMEAEC